jgi:hypothetical protein
MSHGGFFFCLSALVISVLCYYFIHYQRFLRHETFFSLVMDASTTPFQPLAIPRDSEGYVKSFTLSSYDGPGAEEARAFFKQYGFVVVANVFTPEQCATTISDIWDVIESSVDKPVRHDETLWTSQYVFVISFGSFHIPFFSEFGLEQDLYKKVLLVMLVCGLDKFYSIDRSQPYIPPSRLFLGRKISWLIKIVMACFDRPKSILGEQP